EETPVLQPAYVRPLARQGWTVAPARRRAREAEPRDVERYSIAARNRPPIDRVLQSGSSRQGRTPRPSVDRKSTIAYVRQAHRGGTTLVYAPRQHSHSLLRAKLPKGRGAESRGYSDLSSPCQPGRQRNTENQTV